MDLSQSDPICSVKEQTKKEVTRWRMTISVALNAPIDRPHYGVFPDVVAAPRKGPISEAASIRIVFLNTTGSRRSRERPSPPRQFKQQPGAIAAAASDRSNYVHGKSKHFHSWRELLDRQHNRARRWRCHTSTDRKSRFVANLGRRSGSGDFLALRSNPKLKVTATDRKETP